MNYETSKTEIMKRKYEDLRNAQDYEGIARELNKNSRIDNPNPQGQVPKPVSLRDVLDAVVVGEYAKLLALPVWLVRLADTDEVAQAILISQLPLSKAALDALFSATELDPSWSAKISGPSRANELGLPVVRAAHVQRVLA